MGERNDWQGRMCGGDKIHHDATVIWNQDRGDWDVVLVHDAMACTSCPDGGEPVHVPMQALASQNVAAFGAMKGGV